MKEGYKGRKEGRILKKAIQAIKEGRKGREGKL
jgi:hypothetical protein